ncbi:MAG: PAS domain-containing protein [Vicinamibacteria bacterium]|jgi:transcriptional regulator with PAS, ATPase and Fis domain|nr:PAS domain-containing protein [Vicinamibacteria bacterium]
MNWMDGIDAAITVCDGDGVIVAMNEASALAFEKDGGRALIGRNLLDCHPEPARTKLVELLSERRSNTYTIEKNGKQRLIHQTPWFEKGEFRGLVEISLPIPFAMPHFVRDKVS